MKGIMKKAAPLLLLLGLVTALSNCIMEDRVVELVLNDKTCPEFTTDQDTVSFVLPVLVDYASELDSILSDNGVEREELVSAHLVSVLYGVTGFDQTHDWTITGAITVERFDIADGPATLVDYASYPITSAAVGIETSLGLNSAGVGVMNRALSAFLADSLPVLIFKVNNSGVSPRPSRTDRIKFDWKACVSMQIVTKADIEVPDPF